MLVAVHKAGRLKFFGNHAALADTQAFADYLAPLKRSEWVVYSKRPFGGPEAVLAYGFEALAASVEIAAPRFAATSDPPHLALRVRTWRRWREQRRPVRMVREAVALQSALRAQPRP